MPVSLSVVVRDRIRERRGPYRGHSLLAFQFAVEGAVILACPGEPGPARRRGHVAQARDVGITHAQWFR